MDIAKFFKLTIKNQRFNYKNNVTLFLNIKNDNIFIKENRFKNKNNNIK